MIDNFKFDWGKIALWCVILLFCSAVFLFIAWQFKGCMLSGCNNDPEEFTVELAKRDSTAQHKIDSLLECINRVKASNDSLVKCFTEFEQSRHKILVEAKTESKIAELRPMGELYPQMRKWLSGSRPLNLINYPFDSLDVLSMAKKKIEYDWLKQDNGLLTDEVLNLNSQITNYKWQVSDLTKINQLKDEQLVKLESIPRTTINVNKRKWYTDAMIITGSVAFGFTAGIIYRNLSK